MASDTGGSGDGFGAASTSDVDAAELGSAIDELLRASENVSQSSQQISDLAQEQSDNMREVAGEV